MSRSKKVRRKVGDIIAIPLGDNRTGFGLVQEEPLITVLSYVSSTAELPKVEDLMSSTVAFRVWVMNSAVTSGRWPVIAHVKIPEHLSRMPWFFKRDPISGVVVLTQTGAEEIPANDDRWKEMECAAVWEPDHVIERLNDYVNGRVNKWVELMRASG